MRQQHMATVGFGSLFVATPADAAGEDVAAAIAWSISATSTAIGAGYRAAPALMLCLLVLILVPLTAFICRLARWWRRQEPQAATPAPEPTLGPALDVHASLEVVGKVSSRIELLHDMVRIGRADDNDIRITSNRVHRYHAAIHREEFGVYRITDLAGDEGNGVCVNGKPCDEAELRDGDVIELGPGRLRFHAGLV